ncbi:MAG: ChbG/HpnK family deacetylase [Deltaproteobacteria bacterium]|nr:ChbG/HpnK family deacetylase [Deltaproteobacteria bacterium]
MKRLSGTPGPEIRVIINADDLGHDDGINDATFRLMEAGKVTSATLMANGDAIEAAAARVREFPHCSFGAHLNLTEFHPVTKDPGLDFLLGPDGAFADRRDALCRWGLVLDGDRKEALFNELRAQVDRIRNLGVKISHLDSHNHTHTIGALMPVIKRVQRECGIRRVRVPMNLFDDDRYNAGRSRRLKNRMISLALRSFPRAVGPDWFTSFATFLSPVAQAPVRPGSTVELMAHPGHPMCDRENALLETDWESGLPFTIRRITYNDI